MNYRADIDGLRAVAVLSVVLFHLGVPEFQGGYVGVDVFFVISGFLITSIIKHKYETQGFVFSDFYVRRIRRLIPPLVATVAVTFFASAWIMTPYDLANFSRSAIAALFSLSNFVFFFESGYWDTASELKPLLHTWSLGVEEQFYLFWPALIVGLLGLRRYVKFGVSLAVISLLGAALCIWYTRVDQSAAFYLLPFRVFQFTIGALLIPLAASLRVPFFEKFQGSRTFLLALGLLALALSIFSFDAATDFPGWAVLLPSVGAGLVLLGGTGPRIGNSALRGLMENPVSLWVGRVSYSMYLVHWPLIVLYRYHYGMELTFTDQIVLALGTVFFTCVLHYAVEHRFYRRATIGETDVRPVSTLRFSLGTFMAAGLVALLASSAWLGDGWAWRFPPASLSVAEIEQGGRDRLLRLSGTCKLVSTQVNEHACNYDAPTQLLVFGNSTEPDGLNFIKAGYGQDAALNLITFGGTQGCADMRFDGENFFSSTQRCQRQFDALLDPAMIARLDIVLYSANRPYDYNKTTHLALLQALKRHNPDIQIVTLGGYINTKRHCAFYINKSNTTDACALPENGRYFADDPSSGPLSKEFRAIEAHYIDRVALLCKNRVLQTCLTRTGDGVPAFYDKVHLSLEFSEMSGKLYARKHPRLLESLRPPQ